MRQFPLGFLLPAVLVGSLLTGVTRADDRDKTDAKAEPGAETKAPKAPEIPQVGLLDGLRSGELAVQAEGTGDGKMTIAVTNRSNRQLNVVLPPGLIASGATGQFGGGGFGGGGMGGGMGGMGGMGGGMMGGMGGGMGGMGGGMGGMGGGMGGGMMGGGMGGGGMGSMVMPPMMGMMMLAGVIVRLTGELDSWDFMSQRLSYMAGFGGGMMGGMGGGMGGMGGGMGGMGGMGGGMMGGMGGMGGGFRSVPATELPYATVKPGQTRKLPTKVVSLTPPTADGLVVVPAKSERLVLGDISQLTKNDTIQKALRLLAAEKAPDTVAQLVLWRLAAGMDWNLIRQSSRRWANTSEIAMAQQFVARLSDRDDVDQPREQGRLYLTVESTSKATEALAADLRKVLKDSVVLGLVAQPEVPDHPEGPAVACRIKLAGTAEKPEATVLVGASDSHGRKWVSAGKFSLPLNLARAEGGELKALVVADSLASGLLDRLVHVTLLKDHHRGDKGKQVYKIRIDNASPLVLDGLMLVGTNPEAKAVPTTVLGIGIAPRKNMTVPATEDAVERLGLKKGIRAFAADLSGL